MLVKGLSNAMYDVLSVDIILCCCGSPEWPLSFDQGLVNFNNFLGFFWKQNTKQAVPAMCDNCKFIHEDFQTTSLVAIILSRHVSTLSHVFYCEHKQDSETKFFFFCCQDVQ